MGTMPSKEKHKLVQLAEAFGADGTKATKLVNEKIDLWKKGGVGLDPKAKGSAVEIVDGLIQFSHDEGDTGSGTDHHPPFVGI
jgi:hypothetical protein